MPFAAHPALSIQRELTRSGQCLILYDAPDVTNRFHYTALTHRHPGASVRATLRRSRGRLSPSSPPTRRSAARPEINPIRLRAALEFLVHRLQGRASLPVAVVVRVGAYGHRRGRADPRDDPSEPLLARAVGPLGAPCGIGRAHQQPAPDDRALRHGAYGRGADCPGADAEPAA